MRVFIVIFVFLISLFGYWFWVSVYETKVLAIEKVGDITVRGVSQDGLFRMLDHYQKAKIVRIILPDGKDKVFSLEDLGITIDVGDFWYQRNSPKYLVQNFNPKLRFGVGKIIISTDEEATVSAEFVDDGFFVVSSGNKIYELSVGEIVPQIVSDFGKREISIASEFRVIEDTYSAFSEINNSLRQVYKDELILKVKDGSGHAELEIPKEVIVNSFDVEKLKRGEVDLDTNFISGFVNKKLTLDQRDDFNQKLALDNIDKEIKSRFYSGSGKGVVLGIDDGPTTDGKLASKYLEVDISQQKMYLFTDGFLYKEYKVSTGNYYPTPVGQYKILNKAPKAYSDIFGVWMPYWMAFSYAEDIGAYLGLHELPYVAGGDGERIYRFGYYIGKKMTGGCVAMEPKDSKEVYEMSDVGMAVNIVP